jgi:hypothetical protein
LHENHLTAELRRTQKIDRIDGLLYDVCVYAVIKKEA